MTPDEKAFFRAAKNADLGTLQALLERDRALLHATDDEGSTPLHWAAWKGHPQVAELLIAAGADVNAVNRNDHWGTTPLHAAAHGNQKLAAEVLLNHGADIAAVNMHGRTPLGETTIHNATAVAKLLKARGAA